MHRENTLMTRHAQTRLLWLRQKTLGLGRHWLAGVNLLMGVLVGLPWLAPILMKIGATSPAWAIYFVYSFLCHQLADRSFFLFGPRWMYSYTELLPFASSGNARLWLRAFVGTPELGYKVAWSDRMVALYGSLFLGGLLFALLRRRLRPLNWRVFGLLISPMILDGTTHLLSDLAGLERGFRYDNAWLAALTGNLLPQGFYVGNGLGSFNSWMRLSTGLLFGLAVAWISYPALDAIFMGRTTTVTMNERETLATRARYDRIAPLYDWMEALAERRYGGWRERAWSLVAGPQVLEVGVGTGKNIPHYPSGIRVTGIDLSEKMLVRARRRAAGKNTPITLHQMDVQALEFPDGAFDSAIATFVFCSVPDPVAGLREMARVVRPGGRIVLLEHVRSENPRLGRLMDWLDPLVTRLMGPHINRRTVENVRRAGLVVERVEDLGAEDIFKLIVAHSG